MKKPRRTSDIIWGFVPLIIQIICLIIPAFFIPEWIYFAGCGVICAIPIVIAFVFISPDHNGSEDTE